MAAFWLISKPLTATPPALAALAGARQILFFKSRCTASVVEGIFALYYEELLDLYDLAIYVDTEDDIRFIRRLKRDVDELGREVEDAAVAEDTLYVVQENGLFKVVAITLEGSPDVQCVDTLQSGEMEILGFHGDELVILRTFNGYSFSIVGVDRHTGSEKELIELKGKPAYLDFREGKLFIQFSNGIFMRFSFAEGGFPEILSSGYVPFKIKAAAFMGEKLCLLGEGGRFTSRPIGDYEPGSIDMLKVTSPVRLLTTREN